ncbi:(2Fe-2S)-binding protein [Nocardia sp. NPDC049707]|uniref:(2Fe-2S)-binding protein n=1 Tax=Nocardia sp. NPDC049707 TaxID=3154735 RepID=UPI00341364FB
MTRPDIGPKLDRARKITIITNGDTHAVEVDVRTPLSDALRRDLHLTGTHVGCEHGVCGACTVLLDGRAVRSCLLLAVQADEHEVTTVEGLSGDGTLNSLQSAFRSHHALQCGFCTPGILCTLTDALRTSPAPTEDDIRAALTGNLCRCTGYQNIVEAAVDAAAALRGAGDE